MPLVIKNITSLKGVNSIGGVGAFDANALALVNAITGGGDSLTNVQKGDIDRFFKDCKDIGVFDGANILNSIVKACYLFAGSTLSAFKWNAIDPRDLDAAFRLTFFNAPTASANGVAWNGTTQYADTFLLPSTALTANDTHLSYYSRTNSNTAADGDIGTIQNAAIGFYNKLRLSAQELGQYYCYGGNQGGYIEYKEADSRGFFVSNRQSINDFQIFKNGKPVVIESFTNSDVTLPSTRTINIGRVNDATPVYGDKQCCFASIGKSMTPYQNIQYYNIIQRFQTNWGRNV